MVEFANGLDSFSKELVEAFKIMAEKMKSIVHESKITFQELRIDVLKVMKENMAEKMKSIVHESKISFQELRTDVLKVELRKSAEQKAGKQSPLSLNFTESAEY
jgi:hypothetical protein